MVRRSSLLYNPYHVTYHVTGHMLSVHIKAIMHVIITSHIIPVSALCKSDFGKINVLVNWWSHSLEFILLTEKKMYLIAHCQFVN